MNIWTLFPAILVDQIRREAPLAPEKNIDRLSADIDASLYPLVEQKEE